MTPETLTAAAAFASAHPLVPRSMAGTLQALAAEETTTAAPRFLESESPEPQVIVARVSREGTIVASCVAGERAAREIVAKQRVASTDPQER